MKAVLAIPCLNEEAILRENVEKTLGFIDAWNPAWLNIVIAVVDNGSQDGTEAVGRQLASQYPDRVDYARLGVRGKGRAVRHAWTSHRADLYAFMDADLSTDLSALPVLLDRCRANGGLAIGSRRLPESETQRSPLRRLFSWGYKAIAGAVLSSSISDFPCGFKCASSGIIRDILPQVEDDRWFFDTELAIRSERAGFAVTEVPVNWKEIKNDRRKSKISLVRVSTDYIKQAWRLRRTMAKEMAAEKAVRPNGRQGTGKA